MPRQYTQKVSSACQQCGRERLYRPCEVKKFCSHACYVQSRTGTTTIARVIRECGFCRVLMTMRETARGIFCSKKCADQAKVQPVAERFWAKVNMSGGPEACWPWTAGVGTDGYGKFWIDGQTVHASRIAFVLAKGPLDPGQLACHDCPSGDFPLCCNPSHLFASDHAGNSADMAQKGRSTKGDRHFSRTHPERVARGDRHRSRTSPETIKRGSDHGMAKLTEEAVIAIRERRANGDVYRVIAADFGITKSQACAVARRRSWKHVA